MPTNLQIEYSPTESTICPYCHAQIPHQDRAIIAYHRKRNQLQQLNTAAGLAIMMSLLVLVPILASIGPILSIGIDGTVFIVIVSPIMISMAAFSLLCWSEVVVAFALALIPKLSNTPDILPTLDEDKSDGMRRVDYSRIRHQVSNLKRIRLTRDDLKVAWQYHVQNNSADLLVRAVIGLFVAVYGSGILIVLFYALLMSEPEVMPSIRWVLTWLFTLFMSGVIIFTLASFIFKFIIKPLDKQIGRTLRRNEVTGTALFIMITGLYFLIVYCLAQLTIHPILMPAIAGALSLVGLFVIFILIGGYLKLMSKRSKK